MADQGLLGSDIIRLLSALDRIGTQLVEVNKKLEAISTALSTGKGVKNPEEK